MRKLNKSICAIIASIVIMTVWVSGVDAQVMEWGVYQEDRTAVMNPERITAEGKPVLIRVSEVPDWSGWDRIVIVIEFGGGRTHPPLFRATTGTEYMAAISESLFPGVPSMSHVLLLWPRNNRGAADFTVDAYPFERVDERHIFSRQEVNAISYTMRAEIRGMEVVRYEDVYENDEWQRRPVYGAYTVLAASDPVEVVTTERIEPVGRRAPSLDDNF